MSHDAAQFQYGTPTPGPLPTTGLDVAPLAALGAHGAGDAGPVHRLGHGLAGVAVVRSYDGTPMVCDGAAIHGPAGWPVIVDQTPVVVAARMDGATGMVEFTRDGVSVFVAADAPITAITATYKRVPDAR